MSINIGINGFGRIGRVIARILATKKFKVVLINEIDEDVNNLAYLFKYDSTMENLVDLYRQIKK